MKKTIQEHVINKLFKTSNKKKTLKAAQLGRGKTYYVQKNEIRMTTDFLSETMQARLEWSNSFKVLRKPVNLEFYTQKNILQKQR